MNLGDLGESLVRRIADRKQMECWVDIEGCLVVVASSRRIDQLVVCLCPTGDVVSTVQ